MRHRLSSAETGPALRALAEWTPADAPSGGLHPGDLGWHLRFDDAEALLWTDGEAPVAVGYLDDGVLRVTTAPSADREALAAEVEELFDGAPGSVDGLPMPGWDRDPDAWAVLSWTPRPVTTRAQPVGAGDVADRVLVQRSAFKNSTFTIERRQAMLRSPAAALADDVLVRTPAGEPAAAATGWFAGEGRCGLLEPVGTHADHRGHGYGREAVWGACAALAARGASAVAVVTPVSNVAAVALYRSAGFTQLRENHDWIRRA
ncbi:N-acetyltransferase [Paractinoplanes abujensis]|uniref:Ribosomal protein S18 acetylase RimI-like enzyme n=1 Tax=Paractinoplanes abujensis TaxID=882441 RepID=A0A7W7CS45_9ACTN|nr:GNAT family N-acetyltransferase [Actinoplanes abujensis]MBB4693706.1 ribosomal protein S18 acetylase RimI-like enzyme [Actinoplanes abujensis]GID21637.1 N-acetyltransferase [Actinoplanes abujensis]